MADREQFETWARAAAMPLARLTTGDYAGYQTHCAWLAWQHVAAPLRMLDEYIVCDVECNGVTIRLPGDAGRPWYDIRPMLDEREHSPEFIDQARDAIGWGLHRGVLRRHADVPHLIQTKKVGA